MPDATTTQAATVAALRAAAARAPAIYQRRIRRAAYWLERRSRYLDVVKRHAPGDPFGTCAQTLADAAYHRAAAWTYAAELHPPAVVRREAAKSRSLRQQVEG